jgi:hypothetical protein
MVVIQINMAIMGTQSVIRERVPRRIFVECRPERVSNGAKLNVVRQPYNFENIALNQILEGK